MKNLIKIYLVTVPALMLLLASCDYVEKPLQSTGLADVDSLPDFPDNPNTQRNVMLEEFTGHYCAPCPGAAKTARELEAYYQTLGKKFFVVAIHHGTLADVHAPNYLTDYRTNQGDSIATKITDCNITYTPLGYINRAVVSGSQCVDKADWQAAADLQFAKPLVVNMQMIVDYDSTTKKGIVFVQNEFTTNTTGNFFMCIALVQDSIIGYQNNSGSAGDPAYPTGDVPNYVHRHVFRGNITPLLGVPVASGAVSIDQEVILPIAINLNTFPVRTAAPPLKQKNLKLVAYVYDASNLEILQVIEQHLIEH